MEFPLRMCDGWRCAFSTTTNHWRTRPCARHTPKQIQRQHALCPTSRTSHTHLAISQKCCIRLGRRCVQLQPLAVDDSQNRLWRRTTRLHPPSQNQHTFRRSTSKLLKQLELLFHCERSILKMRNDTVICNLKYDWLNYQNNWC